MTRGIAAILLGLAAASTLAAVPSVVNAAPIDCARTFQNRHLAIALAPTDSQAPYSANQLCARGHDLTNWASGKGMSITSGVLTAADGSDAVIAVESTGSDSTAPEYKSELIRISISEKTAQIERQVLARQSPSAVPEDAVDSFTISGYDEHAHVLYIQTPAWATSDAIHAYALASAKPTSWYVAPGNLLAVINQPANEYQKAYLGDLLVEQSAIRGDQGRIGFTTLITPQGKKVCEINTSDAKRPMDWVCKR